MVEVRTVSGNVARAMSGLEIDLPVICRIGIKDDEVIAVGGLAWGHGRCWLFFSVEDGKAKGIVRQALAECETLKRKAIQFGATEIFTPRDANYPTSERLLKLAGFERTDEVVNEFEVWQWRS